MVIFVFILGIVGLISVHIKIWINNRFPMWIDSKLNHFANIYNNYRKIQIYIFFKCNPILGLFVFILGIVVLISGNIKFRITISFSYVNWFKTKIFYNISNNSRKSKFTFLWEMPFWAFSYLFYELRHWFPHKPIKIWVYISFSNMNSFKIETLYKQL